jgi:acyl-CoA synthetase (AMP-forming)/AMP-acid ligase II
VSRIADYKAPDEFVMRAELPLTSMYKVDKRALRTELLGAGSDLDVVSDVDPDGVQRQPHRSRR